MGDEGKYRQAAKDPNIYTVGKDGILRRNDGNNSKKKTGGRLEEGPNSDSDFSDIPDSDAEINETLKRVRERRDARAHKRAKDGWTSKLLNADDKEVLFQDVTGKIISNKNEESNPGAEKLAQRSLEFSLEEQRIQRPFDARVADLLLHGKRVPSAVTEAWNKAQATGVQDSSVPNPFATAPGGAESRAQDALAFHRFQAQSKQKEAFSHEKMLEKKDKLKREIQDKLKQRQAEIDSDYEAVRSAELQRRTIEESLARQELERKREREAIKISKEEKELES